MTKKSARFCYCALFLLITVLSPSVTFPAFSSPPPCQSAVKNAQQQRASGRVDDNGFRLVEEFSFSMKDFKINHQGETNNLNIAIRYQYKQRISPSDYPDFRLIAKDIEVFLSNYRNDDDYWEVLNKKITTMVLRKYTAITKITSDIQVSPSSNDPYQRSTIVTRERT